MRKYLIVLLAILLISCGDSGKKVARINKYFDAKVYFEGEAARLQKLNPLIEKQVTINGEAEVKNVRIADWKKEFEIFISADINKVNWDGLIKVQKNDSLELYTSNNEKVFVKRMIVEKTGRVPSHIEIIIRRENMLYTSVDTLSYRPDSLYSIKKQQNIRLLKSRSYAVTGNFK